MIYVYCLTFADGTLTVPTFFIHLTRPRNADFLLKSHCVLLAIDVATSVADIAILYVNMRRLRRHSSHALPLVIIDEFRIDPQYSLSGSYQTSENVAVTTRLLLPLDVTSTALYLTYLALSVWFRARSDDYTLPQLITIFEWVWLVRRCACSM